LTLRGSPEALVGRSRTCSLHILDLSLQSACGRSPIFSRIFQIMQAIDRLRARYGQSRNRVMQLKSPGCEASRARCAGITLIEVLIALVVFSIGLLGLAGLQTVSLRFNTSAYYRTQATALAYGLADRMRANREGALNGFYNADFDDPPPDCDPAADGGGGTPADDLAAWRNALACQLPLGTGAVASNGSVFTITVHWDDSHGEQDPMDFEFTTGL